MLIFDIFLQKGVNYLLLLLVPIYFGVDVFNQLMLALTIVGLTSQIQHLGIEAIAVREFQKDQTNIQRIRLIKILASIIAALVYALAIGWIATRSDPGLALFIPLAIVVFLAGEVSIIASHSQSVNKYRGFVRVRMLASLLTAVLKATAILLFSSISLFVLGYLLNSVLIVIIYRFGKKTYNQFKIAVDIPYQKNLISKNFPIFLGALSFSVLHRVDIIMLQMMGWQGAVGSYSFAAQTLDVFVLLFLAYLSNVTGPLFRLTSKPKKQNFLYQRLRRRFVGMSLAVSILASVAASGLLFFELSNVYKGIVVSFIILTPALSLMVYRHLQSKMIVIKKIPSLSMSSNIIALFFNIIFNFLLIPQYGTWAAAVTTFFSILISVILVEVGLCRKNKIQP